jgi:signal transduction histidine kinase
MSADNLKAPVPANELERLMALADLDLDYTDLNNSFKDLTKLAAKIAGTDISMVNLLDMHTQWTVSNFGLEIDQMPREASVCQYTVAEGRPFEVKNLAADDRFKEKFYVTDDPNLRYYYGVPITAEGDVNIGALCVMDRNTKDDLPPEKTEMLKIIADEIVNRLKAIKAIDTLKHKLHETRESQKRIAHDIRGPIGGIIGLARVISEQGDENTLEEVLEFISLIQKSGHSILELANEILSVDTPKKNVRLGANDYNQLVLKDKLEKLYAPQAVNKKIKFEVITNPESEYMPFSKNKLLQIVGNLISNAMKFTPIGGDIIVRLAVKEGEKLNHLHIVVEDSGVGMDAAKIEEIIAGKGKTTDGTSGEQGFGFGLALVKHLVEDLEGHMYIASKPGSGTTFEIILPQAKVVN